MQDKILTRGEMHLMRILWAKKRVFISDVMAGLPNPKPAPSTVSTVMRVLVDKGFVTYTSYGKCYQYRPTVSRLAYADRFLAGVRDMLFDGSDLSLVLFFARSKRLTEKDRQELIRILETE